MAKLKTTPAGRMIIEVDPREGSQLASIRPANLKDGDLKKVFGLIPLKELASQAVALGETPNPTKTVPQTAAGRTLEAALVTAFGIKGLQDAGVEPTVVDRLVRTSEELEDRTAANPVDKLIQNAGLSIRYVEANRTPELERLQDSIEHAKDLQQIANTSSRMAKEDSTPDGVEKANLYLSERDQLQHVDEEGRSLSHLTPVQQFAYSRAMLVREFYTTLSTAIGDYKGDAKTALLELDSIPGFIELAKIGGDPLSLDRGRGDITFLGAPSKPGQKLDGYKQIFEARVDTVSQVAHELLPPFPPSVRPRTEGPGNVGL